MVSFLVSLSLKLLGGCFFKGFKTPGVQYYDVFVQQFEVSLSFVTVNNDSILLSLVCSLSRDDCSFTRVVPNLSPGDLIPLRT